MNYTLDISGERKVTDPSREEIRQAILDLDIQGECAFLILHGGGPNFLQTTGSSQTGYTVEYGEGEPNIFYRAATDSSTEQITAMFHLYLAGSDDWKGMTEWERIDFS